MNLHDRDIKKAAREEGIAEGQMQKAIEDAKRMLIKKYPTDDISEITGLPLEQLQELAEQLAAQPAPAQA